MLPYNYDSLIFLLRKYVAYKSFINNPNPILQTLNNEFKNPRTKTDVGNGIIADGVIGNTFKFSFLGHNFITKLEISYDTQNNKFEWGEINTYYINKEIDKEVEVLILKYTYNITGTILNSGTNQFAMTIADFSEPYYMDFFQMFMEHATKNKLKFQLL